jgi:hypothetical protein
MPTKRWKTTGATDVYRNLLNNGIRTPQRELNMAGLLFYVEDYETAKLFIKRLLENKQADASQKARAYELLNRKTPSAQKEREEPKVEEKNPRATSKRRANH